MAFSDQFSTHDALEEIFQVPLWECPNTFVGWWRTRQNATASSFLRKGSIAGVLIRVELQHNLFGQVANFLFASFQVRFWKRYLESQGRSVLGVYGIYPTLEAPTIVYVFGTYAEKYCLTCVLPPLEGRWAGFLRRILMAIGGFHPSLGGVIILVEKD